MLGPRYRADPLGGAQRAAEGLSRYGGCAVEWTLDFTTTPAATRTDAAAPARPHPRLSRPILRMYPPRPRVLDRTYTVLRSSTTITARNPARTIPIGSGVRRTDTGVVVDRQTKRRLLLLTQSSLAAVSLALGALVLSGAVRLWMVFAVALVFGTLTALDNPRASRLSPKWWVSG
jgi:hypothetical protein